MRRPTAIVAAGASCALLAGCATSEIAHLRNSAGMTVQCGPYQAVYSIYASADYLTSRMLRDCIEDYQRQGYERLAAPKQ